MRNFIKSSFLALTLALSPIAVLAQDSKPAVVEQVSTININTADQSTLEKLNGVGPVKARAIIEYREANGAFQTVEDLDKVKGIGPATMEKNKGKYSI